ncbi:hypothetical protein BUALT_Bualt01G0107000 [Buddleja alternifolia]|uniref:RRM domain-containing protein n=1 Tax=Buddleja alternifolia TaxID=168488 RepID=A0AAV6Y7H3_9LAMI|nr:hypothetical protein BUALT_Bualt01G0107000 [Buddleja alternifolia]
MDDDPSKNQETLFPLETCPPVSDEAFNLFHSIDRRLFARLIQNLGRDPAESMQVMALWMWLERQGNDSSLINRMLSLPLMIVNELADETVSCLRCVENDSYVFGDGGYEITLLPELVGSRRGAAVISLRFFHENRIAVLRGVSKIVGTVCVRAFNDILMRVWHGKGAAVGPVAEGGGNGGRPPVGVMGGVREVGESSRDAEMRSGGGGAPPPPPVMPVLYHPYMNVPFAPLPRATGGGLIRMPQPPPPPQVLPPTGHRSGPVAANATGIPIHMLAGGNFPAYDFRAQRQMLSNELGEMLSRNLSINSGEEISNVEEEGEDIPADDRTIFLTFSKGYPISEDEVRDYFTRRFGDFIEDIIMQEVGEDEQVLYARMVVARRSTAVINGIVGGNKEKYSINGKHVWARKYVKKSRSPPRGGDS